jgi:hypothetical protein
MKEFTRLPMLTVAGLVQLLCFASACVKKGSQPEPPVSTCIYQGVDTCQKNAKTAVTVHLNTVRQTIHSFGASDCWSTKFIGRWADASKKNQIADLLFSLDTTADGSPKGIGLSLWRFNIGAGSFEQGDTSNITTDWRREECFLQADGSYDWTKQAGQQWFLQAARQRGVAYSLGFSLSPPVFMTQNHRAFNSSGGTRMNIQVGKMDAYASFLAEVSKHFQFDFLSPVNEPQWAWGQASSASQEGTQAVNDEVAQLARLASQKLAGTLSKVVVGEAGSIDYLYGGNNDGRGDLIGQFFSPTSINYIGGEANVARTISAHSYFTTCPDDNLVNKRLQVVNRVNQVNSSLQVWQTEFGILGDICGQYNGSPRNTSIDYGLYVAKVLHHDLAVMNVTSWQWWLAVSPYNYSDALVYINAPNGTINVDGTKQDGNVLDSKQLWAFGNFARFVRPGMKRIDVSVQGINDPQTAAGSLMVSAYKDEASKKLVCIIVNPKSSERTLNLTGDNGFTITGNALNAYTTSLTDNLKKTVVSADNITIPARSIVTLSGTYQ